VFDATAHGVTGIAFDLDRVPDAGLRVLFPTPSDAVALGPDYWGAAEYYLPSPVQIGTNVVPLSEVFSPEAVPTPLDTHGLTQIGFLVASNPAARTNFSFCVSNLRLLLD
jgi:hypothetical protein